MARYSVFVEATGVILRGGFCPDGQEINMADTANGENVFINNSPNANHIDDGKHLIVKDVQGNWVLVDKAPSTPTGPECNVQAQIYVHRMLAASDIEVMADRWEAMDPQTRSAWARYRQTLRDMTKQTFDIFPTYPTRPDAKTH